MKYNKSIHWHEGLFLRQHHFQQLQSNIYSSMNEERKAFNFHTYGVRSIVPSESSLENNLLNVDSLVAIMPSGQEICIPGNTTLKPFKIDETIFENEKSRTVYLAVPLWTLNDSNTNDSSDDAPDMSRIYNIIDEQCNDENNGTNSQLMLFREINASLVLDPEKFVDMEFLPLFKISPAKKQQTDKAVEFDKKYIQPCLSIEGSDELHLILKSFHNQMLGYREELVASLRYTGYTVEELSGSKLELILRLRSLNSYTSRLSFFLGEPSCHPYKIYLEFISLAGELAALFPMKDIYQVPQYNHLDLYTVFSKLIEQISALISIASLNTYMKVKCKDIEPGYCTAELSEENLIKAEEYYLAVETHGDSQEVISILEKGDHFKMTSPTTENMRVRGIPLDEDRNPPQTLPSLHNVIWFRIKRFDNASTWERMREEKKIALKWAEKSLPKMNLTIYITIRKEDTDK